MAHPSELTTARMVDDRSRTDAAPLHLRRLSEADLDRLEELRAQAGFNQTIDDWRRLLRLEPDGCFAAVRGGRVVGSVTTTVYSGRLGWIGMVIVDRDARRLGVASALVEGALRHLELDRGVHTVGLDATPAGKQVYDRLGFLDQFTLHRVHGSAPLAQAPDQLSGTRPMSLNDLEAVAAMDSAVVGSDRTALLTDLLASDPNGCSVVESDGRVSAFAFRRRGAHRWHVGPVVGFTWSAAEKAARATMVGIPGEAVELDVIDGSAQQRVASSLRLEAARPFIRMARGRPLPTFQTTAFLASAAPEAG